MRVDTLALILAGFGNVKSTDALPYLVLAYSVFFVVIFAYVISLSRRQSRVQDDLALLRKAIDEEKR
jgi:CcmD family protein